MNTAPFNDWSGNMFGLGPLYPLVGWEVPMAIVGVLFWIGWHVLQIRMERRIYAEEARRLRQGDHLQKALQAEHTPERM